MFAALGQGINEFSAGRLVVNPEGRLKIPPLLLLLAARRRILVLLTIREPVALFEFFPGRPNGAKDRFVQQLAFERKAPLCFDYKVDRDVNFQRGSRKEL